MGFAVVDSAGPENVVEIGKKAARLLTMSGNSGINAVEDIFGTMIRVENKVVWLIDIFYNSFYP